MLSASFRPPPSYGLLTHEDRVVRGLIGDVNAMEQTHLRLGNGYQRDVPGIAVPLNGPLPPGELTCQSADLKIVARLFFTPKIISEEPHGVSFAGKD